MMIAEKNLIIISLVFIALIFFSTLTRAEDSQRTFFKVNNLSCGACSGKIDAKLKTFGGYKGMLANVDRGLVAVEHSQNLAESEICEAITSIGYPARVAFGSEYNQHRLLSSDSPGWISPADSFFARLLKIFKI